MTAADNRTNSGCGWRYDSSFFCGSVSLTLYTLHQQQQQQETMMTNEATPFVQQENAPVASLTRQEVACLKTALALVIVKRRLQERADNNNDDDDNASSHNTKKRKEIPLIQGLQCTADDEFTPTHMLQLSSNSNSNNSSERYRQHVTHMMDLALKQMEQLEEQQQQSHHHHHHESLFLRLESLVTHLACQLEAWWNAAIAKDEQEQQQQQQDEEEGEMIDLNQQAESLSQQQQQQQGHSTAVFLQWIQSNLFVSDEPFLRDDDSNNNNKRCKTQQRTILHNMNISTTLQQQQVHLWSLLLQIKPLLVSQWLVPMLMDWFYQETVLATTHHSSTSTTSTMSTTRTTATTTTTGHYWNLLETALLEYAPMEICQDALQTLIVWNQQMSLSMQVQDLPGQYLRTVAAATGRGKNPRNLILLQWAMVDLVQRLLTRLSSIEYCGENNDNNNGYYYYYY